MKQLTPLAAVLAALCLIDVSCTEELGVGSEQADGSVADGAGNTDATPQADGATGPVMKDASASSDSATVDATSSPLEDGGCGVVLAQEGAVVPIQVMNDATPTLMGGTLVPGTYVLTAYRVHGAGPQGTGNVRETLVLTGTNAVGALKRLSEASDTTGDFSSHGPLGEHFTFTGDVHVSNIFRTEDCPASTSTQPVQVSVTGSTLVMLESATSTERVYTRIH
jgi:hypothetical protein